MVNRLAAIILGLVLLVSGAGFSSAQDAQITPPEGRGLQTQLQPVSAEFDWREAAGVQDPAELSDETPAWLSWLVRNYVNVIFTGIAVMLLIIIAIVLVRQGRGGRFNTARDAPEGSRTSSDPVAATAAVSRLRLTLDEIVALDDLRAALGALLRLVLETALRLTGAALRRSATAREILRRLPQDFDHVKAVATLVREAEAVRFGGADLDRERFEELVALVRPLLAAGARA